MNRELATLYRRDLTRLEQEIAAFPDDDSLWATVPGIANAAGNLALHLEGNLREYIGRQLAGIPYTRDREFEFGARGLTQREILRRVEALQPVIPEIVDRLTNEQLDAIYPEAQRGITRRFVLHLYGHLNFHLGQIGYLRRMLTQGSAVQFVQG